MWCYTILTVHYLDRHFLCHEKSIQSKNSIVILNKCRTDINKFINKSLLKHNKIFPMRVTCREIYGYSYNIFLHNFKKYIICIQNTTYYHSPHKNCITTVTFISVEFKNVEVIEYIKMFWDTGCKNPIWGVSEI